MKTTLRRTRGMTLIEVMCASSILAVAMLGLMSANVASSRRLAASNREAQAVALAQELAGLLGTVPYTSTGTNPTGLFSNLSTGNDADITDTAGGMDGAAVTNPISSGFADHQESELPAGVLAALTPLTTRPSTTTPITTNPL